MTGRRILIVDDDAQIRRVVRTTLMAQGYDVGEARTGEEALDKLEGGIEPELIVIFSDINMPGMDGLGLLRRIKAQRADLPVIMVTAYGDDERRRKAAEFGASEFVTKPVDFDLLRQQLQLLSA